jgi:hypothetical protein
VHSAGFQREVRISHFVSKVLVAVAIVLAQTLFARDRTDGLGVTEQLDGPHRWMDMGKLDGTYRS